MPKLLKDPLVHFLLIGAALFAASAWRGEMIRAGRERITITAEQVAKARDTAALSQGHELSPAELRVRRRVVEKMTYLSQDLADPAPSSPGDLRAFYDAHADLFTIPPLVSFDQVYLSPAERGDRLDADAAAALTALRAGKPAEEVGDHTPLRAEYADAPRERLHGADPVAGASTTTSYFERILA
jgi:hypothetical protein